MSNLYPNLIYTTFPDEPCDTYEYMQDLTADLVTLASQYETLINQKRFNEASQLLIDNPSLNRIYFNAEKYNKLIDSIKAIQLLYSEDIQTYILELAKFMGAYSSTTKYTRYNVVQYNDSMIYMCISTSTPLGTPPTDTTYWYPLSVKGDKGDKGERGTDGVDGIDGVDGLGLHFNGAWSASTTYSKDAAVSYGTCLYASLVDDNLSHTPSSNTNDYWSEIIDFSNVTAYDNSASGTTATTMQKALDELYSLSKINKSNISINTTNITTNTNSISNINNRISNINNTADKDKEVKYAVSAGSATSATNANYATSAGSANTANSATTASTCTGNSATATKATNANYASSAGNSDTVDGFHFKASTTDLTAGSSSLTTNTLYFVYE